MCFAKGGFRKSVNQTAPILKSSPARHALRLGFVALTDAAPLILARELGLFRKYGVNVFLSRELGWATIRDKILHRELDGAHALAPMPFAVTLGLGTLPCDCVSALVLNQHGNGITLSNALWSRGVRNGATLRHELVRNRNSQRLMFGVVSHYSSHNFLLRAWLAASGIHPDRDVSIVVVPPPQMTANLKAGHLDGFCAGEPWNSVAVQSQVGWCAAVSAELAPRHPEKVLMVRRDFAEKRSHEHVALVAALLEACEFCDQPRNRAQIISVLARPEYVNASPSALSRGLEGPFDFGHGDVRAVTDFTIFHSGDANEPSVEKAGWVIQHLLESGLWTTPCTSISDLARQVFRTDIFQQAARLRSSTRPNANENKANSETRFALV